MSKLIPFVRGGAPAQSLGSVPSSWIIVKIVDGEGLKLRTLGWDMGGSGFLVKEHLYVFEQADIFFGKVNDFEHWVFSEIILQFF